jgi:hypothetical protein
MDGRRSGIKYRSVKMIKWGLKITKAQPARYEGKLEYFRKIIIDHLSKLENEETAEKRLLKKALLNAETMVKGGMAVGTIRLWKGKKYVKIAPGKWRPKYDNHSQGAKMAISAIRKKIATAKDAHEMLQIVLANQYRFSDKEGHPLPFVRELSDYVDEAQKKFEEPSKTPSKKKIGLSDNKKNERSIGTPEAKADREAEKPARDMADDELRSGIQERVINKKADSERSRELQYEFNQRQYKKKIDRAVPKHIRNQEEEHSSLIPGDYYVDTALENKKKYSVRVVGENDNGNDGYVNASGGSGIERTFGGPAEFDTREDAQKWIDNHPRKPEKESRLLQINKDWIDHNINGEVDKNGYLLEKNKKGEVIGKIKLSGQNLDYYNSAKNGQKSDKGRSDFDNIKERYQKANSIEGDEDEIQLGKETMIGKWKLVEADTPTASHDENTFHKIPGFPVNEDGSTINDRDYGHDKAAQEAVMNIGSDFDGRALKFDNPVVITGDGIVISGNNRTMSSKIAAKKGTDKAYIEALKKRAKKFGFTVEQVERFKNPRVVFEVENRNGYSTEQFAKFNQSTKKEMGPTERAVKVSKLIKPETIEAIAGKIGEFETLGELYADRGTVQSVFGRFKDAGLIGENETGKYIEDGAITEDGKTFIEIALLGSVMNENNIRGFNRPGCKSIRSTLVRAIAPLVENKGFNGYSINRELNEAVDIAMQVAINRDKFKTVDEFSKQGNMFESLDPVSVELAKKLEGTQKSFAEFMQKMNGGLKYASNGEADIFLGGVETRDDILSRFLNVKKAVEAVIGTIPLPDLLKSLINLGEGKTA